MSQINEITEIDELNKIVALGNLVVVDFTAKWCAPCKIISPIFESFIIKYPNATFIKVDVDESEELVSEHDISCMPTFIFFKNGSKIETMSGADTEQLQELVKNNY